MDGGPFDAVRGRRTVDVLLQSSTQDLVTISGQADLKGSILVTASSLVMSIAITNLDQTSLRPGLLTLMAFCVPALILAALAILPAGRRKRTEPEKNPLFFAHAVDIPRPTYVAELARICEDDASVYEAIAAQIHDLSVHLELTKFRYLRWGYVALVMGLVASSMVQAVVTIVG